MADAMNQIVGDPQCSLIDEHGQITDDPLPIVALLTSAEKRVILAAGTEFAPFPRAMGILAVNSCRNRLKLIEAEDVERAIWNYRLTPRGVRVKEILQNGH